MSEFLLFLNRRMEFIVPARKGSESHGDYTGEFEKSSDR
jgi:hypothetical protein